MSTSPRAARQRGFTLIEVLAVVAIAALVVTLATTNLHAVAESTELIRTKAEMAHMDARGRMHARTSGETVLLEVEAGGAGARGARLIGQRSGTLLATVRIPEAIGLTVELPRDARGIVFDRRGLSADYALVLHDSSRRVRVAVVGLTGEVIESEVTP